MTNNHDLTSSPIEIVIEPRTGWAALDLKELWNYRELALSLSWRDINVRYKQTILGAAWAVIQPLMMMIVFTVFFGRLGNMKTQTTHPYPVFVYAALLPWQFFSFCVMQGSQSLVASANLISKVYFPRLLIPIATVGVGILDFVIASTILIALMLYYQVIPGIQILLLPILLLFLLAASIGVGTLFSAMAVTYRDVRYVIPFLMQIWMFSSPIAYSIEKIEKKWRLLYCLNPVAGLLASIRSVLLGDPILWDCLLVSMMTSTAAFLLGIFYFRRVERRFADIV